MRASDVLETCLYAEDLDAAEYFYSSVMGLEKFAEVPNRHKFFRAGRGVFLVFNPNETEKKTMDGIGAHGARGEGHVAFAMRHEDIPAWRAQLAQHDVPIESEMDWPNGGFSLYFRDPANNSVELATPDLWGI